MQMGASAASALGGTAEAGRFFRDLRKLYAATHGRTVGSAEYGAALGTVLARQPFPAEQIAEFDRGRYLTPDVLYSAFALAGAIFWRR